jgi:phenylpropionate dioxygenase-like ring-hydroxylating dioxygenase large terminal subunit
VLQTTDQPAPRDGTSLPTDAEVEAALRRAWFPVARVSDLESPRRVDLLGEVLVAFLTDSGEPAIVRDRCPHRGGALSGGHVEGDAIVCPYHGWQWRGDGSCAHVPSLHEGAAIPPRAVTDSFRAEERWGLVWCTLEEPAVPLPAPDVLDGLEWQHGAGRPMHVACGLRAATENFRDVAHFPFVHKVTMGEMPHLIEPLEVHADGTQVRMSREYTAAGGQEEMWHDGMRFSYHAFAPGFVCLEMDGGEHGTRILMNMPCPHTAATRPRADGRHHTTIFWVEGITNAFDEMTLEECLDAEAHVYEEDNPILDAITPSEAPLDPAEQVHSPADKYVLAYRRAFVEFVRVANR